MYFSLGQVIEAMYPGKSFSIEGDKITFEDESIAIPTKAAIEKAKSDMISAAELAEKEKQIKKQQVLTKLGLTADEVAALLA